MKLYLVRHGEALPSHLDPDRALSEPGRRQVEKMSEYLYKLGVKVTDIWHSKKKRAAQTAEILARGLRCGAEQQKGLSPNDPVEPWILELQERENNLLIVGHLPFLPTLAQALLREQIAVSQVVLPESGVLILERNPNGDWSFIAKYIPQQI